MESRGKREGRQGRESMGSESPEDLDGRTGEAGVARGRGEMESPEEERRKWVWVSLKFKVSCERKGGTGRLMCVEWRGRAQEPQVMGRDRVRSG